MENITDNQQPISIVAGGDCMDKIIIPAEKLANAVNKWLMPAAKRKYIADQQEVTKNENKKEKSSQRERLNC